MFGTTSSDSLGMKTAQRRKFGGGEGGGGEEGISVDLDDRYGLSLEG
jgi:hypothetical protein